MIGGCLCGAPDCQRCYPHSYHRVAVDAEIERIAADEGLSWDDAELEYYDRMAAAMDAAASDRYQDMIDG